MAAKDLRRVVRIYCAQAAENDREDSAVPVGNKPMCDDAMLVM